MGTNAKGSVEYRRNERAAQERYNAPKDKAGRDYIARHMDMDKFRANYDDIFRKGPPGVTGPAGCVDEPGPLENDTRPPEVIAAEAKEFSDMAAKACRLHYNPESAETAQP